MHGIVRRIVRLQDSAMGSARQLVDAPLNKNPFARSAVRNLRHSTPSRSETFRLFLERRQVAPGGDNSGCRTEKLRRAQRVFTEKHAALEATHANVREEHQQVRRRWTQKRIVFSFFKTIRIPHNLAHSGHKRLAAQWLQVAAFARLGTKRGAAIIGNLDVQLKHDSPRMPSRRHRAEQPRRAPCRPF